MRLLKNGNGVNKSEITVYGIDYNKHLPKKKFYNNSYYENSSMKNNHIY